MWSFILRLFARYGPQLDQILKNQEIIMATLEQHQAALGRVETATTKAATATTAIAERMKTLEESIKNMGLTTEQETALLAQTEGVAGSAEKLATALEAMGKNPETPVPTDPPTPLESARQSGSTRFQRPGPHR